MSESFAFDKKALIDAMNIVVKAVPARSTMPILQYVLLRSSVPSDSCTIEASDIEHTVSVQVAVESRPKRAVDVLLDPRKAMAIATQSHAIVTIIVSDRDVVVQSDAGAYLTMPTADPSAWPMLRESSENVSHTVNCTGDRLASAINYVLPACDDSDGKFALSGVALFDRHLVASDGKAAHWYALFEPGSLAKKATCIIPSKTIGTMMTLARAHPDELGTLSVAGNNVTLGIGGDRVSGSTISGNFPPIANVIPTGKAKIAKLDASSLADAIGVAAMAVDADMQMMAMHAKGTSIELKCRSPQSECVSSTGCDDDSWDGVKLKLNPHLLRAAVKPLEGSVTIEFRDTVKPIVGYSGDAGFLILPMA